MSLEGGGEKGTGYFFTHKLCPNLDRYDKAEPLTANEMELLLESGNPTALREGINRQSPFGPGRLADYHQPRIGIGIDTETKGEAEKDAASKRKSSLSPFIF